MLCVLIGHALVVLSLLHLAPPRERRSSAEEIELFTSIHPYIAPDIDGSEFLEPEPLRPRIQDGARPQPTVPALPSGALAESAGESAAISPPNFVDWPKEGKDSAARVLAREAEAERVAKMFAGPQGTWAALTKRQRSQLNKFRWKPGIDGLERDQYGQYILTMPNGCTVVNFMFFGCPIGAKPPAHGDMFENMREYFDEQRLPQTDEGNGREPESMRPPKWSKPLERNPEEGVP